MNLPFPEYGKTDKETINNLMDTVIKLRKELEHLLQHIDPNNLDTETAKIKTAQIEQLEVGSNVIMGPLATISWNNVQGAPPPYSDQQALSAWLSTGYATYITVNGLYTGVVAADKIIGNQITAIQRLKIGMNQNASYSMLRLAAGPTWDVGIRGYTDISPKLEIGHIDKDASDTTGVGRLSEIKIAADNVIIDGNLTATGTSSFNVVAKFA